MKRSPIIVLLVAAAIAGLHAWHLSSVLPERVASHFAVDGRPNAWMPRETFLQLYVAIIAIVTVVFGAMGALLKRVPDSLINLPNKAYWLAPERRASTLGWITGWSVWMGCSTLLLMMAIMRQAELVNLGRSQRIAGMPLVVSYVVLSLGMMVAMILKFARKPPG